MCQLYRIVLLLVLMSARCIFYIKLWSHKVHKFLVVWVDQTPTAIIPVVRRIVCYSLSCLQTVQSFFFQRPFVFFQIHRQIVLLLFGMYAFVRNDSIRTISCLAVTFQLPYPSSASLSGAVASMHTCGVFTSVFFCSPE